MSESDKKDNENACAIFSAALFDEDFLRRCGVLGKPLSSIGYNGLPKRALLFLAKTGNTAAQCRLAKRFAATGKDGTALSWFRRASVSGNEEAMLQVLVYYAQILAQKGLVVAKDITDYLEGREERWKPLDERAPPSSLPRPSLKEGPRRLSLPASSFQKIVNDPS